MDLDLSLAELQTRFRMVCFLNPEKHARGTKNGEERQKGDRFPTANEDFETSNTERYWLEPNVLVGSAAFCYATTPCQLDREGWLHNPFAIPERRLSVLVGPVVAFLGGGCRLQSGGGGERRRVPQDDIVLCCFFGTDLSTSPGLRAVISVPFCTYIAELFCC
jgi:hypothetical protein